MVFQNKTNKTVWKESLVVSSILGVTVLSGILLTLPSALADDVVDTITITVPTSCSMSSTIATGNEHTAEINNGQYDSSIGETTIKAFCNDNEGFAIYAIGYTDNELGKNVLTNSTLGSTHDIVTGTAITGNASQWAMKLSTITSPTPRYPIIIAGSTADTLKQQTDPDFSDFTEVPDDYAKVAYRESGTDVGTSAEGSTLRTTYQAYISPTQAAGAYTGQVKYTMVHPYNGTAPVIPVTIADATTMQEVNSCPADLSEEVVYTIKDSRDNQDYKVAKLKDGKCWMVENLNLAGGTALSADDTDMDSSWTLPTANGFQAGNKLPASSPTGTSVSGYYTDDTMAYLTNSGSTTCASDSPCYSYYSWTTATLGSGLSIATDNTDAPYSICPKGWHLPNTYNGSGTVAGATDFRALMIALGGSNSVQTYDSSTAPTGATISSAIRADPYNFLLAGYYSYGSFYNGGSYGYYWSSTSFSDTSYARNLYFNSSNVFSANGYYKGDGFSVRCLFSGR